MSYAAPEFTRDQLDAIGYRELDACVVAGPGSGKTTVLVERYRSLVEDHRFDPRHILAITFTEKAAANMKAKLAELFAHDSLRLRELESAWVSTIHGFCARLLKENAIAAGVDPRFTVLDARESDELRYACVNAALDECAALHRTAALELIHALHVPYLAGDLTDVYDAIRSAGKTIADVRAMENPGAGITPAMVAGTLRQLVQSWTGQTLRGQHYAPRGNPRMGASVFRLPPTRSRPCSKITCPLLLNKVPYAERDPLREFKKALPFLTAWAVDRRTAPFRALIFDVLSRFDEIYNERKLALGALDFNDLERRAVRLLRESEPVRTRVLSSSAR